jgi:nicotinate dehydrogenase subunit B
MNSPASSLPEFIVENPRPGDWFAFALPGRLILKTGKVEIGQDILTALRQIAAEELELPSRMVEVLSGDTSASPTGQRTRFRAIRERSLILRGGGSGVC